MEMFVFEKYGYKVHGTPVEVARFMLEAKVQMVTEVEELKGLSFEFPDRPDVVARWKKIRKISRGLREIVRELPDTNIRPHRGRAKRHDEGPCVMLQSTSHDGAKITALLTF